MNDQELELKFTEALQRWNLPQYGKPRVSEPAAINLARYFFWAGASMAIAETQKVDKEMYASINKAVDEAFSK